MFDSTHNPALEISVADMTAAAAVLKLAVDTKSPVAILGNVLFEGSTITATDIDKRIAWNLPEPVRAPFCIPFAAITKAMKGAGKGKLMTFTPDADGGRVTIECDGLKSRVAALPVEDWPRDVAGKCAIPQGVAGMTQAELHAWLSFTAPAMSDEETRYYLKGVYLHGAGGRLTAVATDGHRMAVSPRSDAWGDGKGAIVPRDAVKALLTALDKKGAGAVALEIYRDATRIVTDQWELQTRNVDGSFPDYTRVIPQDVGDFVDLDTGKTIAAVKRLHGLGDSRSRHIDIDTDAGTLALESDGDAHSMALPAMGGNGACAIGVNAAYLIDALSAFPDAGNLRVRFNGNVNPLRVDANDGAGFYVIMPIRRP